MAEHDIGRRGIDAGTWVKVYLKSDPDTRVRGRLNHPYSGEGNVEITMSRRVTIVPENNVSYVEVQQIQEDDANV